MMINRTSSLILIILLFSCQQEREWNFSHKITLPEDIRPLGIVLNGNYLWISDPDNSRILKIDENGNILEEIGGVNRPMHIDLSNNRLYIPDFYNDEISVYENDNLQIFQIDASFDAPSSVSVLGDVWAFADFYNHRILLFNKDVVSIISQEGRTDGLLYYPTDVKLYNDKVVVADAYNNRVQLFDQKGNFIKVIGWQEEITVATGLDVFDDKLYVTDYYGNKVLVYDFEGVLLQVFEGNFNKPTDVIVTKDSFYVANYGENTLSVFTR